MLKPSIDDLKRQLNCIAIVNSLFKNIFFKKKLSNNLKNNAKELCFFINDAQKII